MLFLTNQNIAEVLTPEIALQCIEDSTVGLADGTVLPQPARSVSLPLSDERTSMFGFEGYDSWFNLNYGGIVFDLVHRMAVHRIYSTDPGFTNMHGLVRRRGREKPAPHLVLLFDIDGNQLVCMMQERAMGSPRVGAMTGLSVKYMAREDSHTIGILGSGSIARPSLATTCLVRDIRLAKVYSPNPAHRQAYAEEMSAKLGIEVRAVASAEKAVRDVDILASLTNTGEPTFDPDWLAAGTHVFCVHGREYDERMLEKADVVAWGYPGARETAYGGHAYPGDTPVPIVDMRRTERWDSIEKYPEKRVYLTDVVTGKAKGRADARQITLCASPAGGTAGIARFAIMAPRIYHLAKEKGLGTELPDDWFDNHLEGERAQSE